MSFQLFDLQGKVALITGGASGLGFACAQALASVGASVVLVSRQTSALQAAQTQLQAAYPNARIAIHAADLSLRSALSSVAQQVSGIFGGPDIVVHAAGLNRRQPIDEVDDGTWDEQIELMLAAPFFLTRHLAPAMKAKGFGRVVLFGSLQSQRAFDNSLPYGVAKGGTLQMARAMAQAWSAGGINVNVIAPGFFRTALTEPVFSDPVRAQALAEKTAIKRNGVGDDLHGAVIFLCSQASQYITGQTLFVDGGFTAL